MPAENRIAGKLKAQLRNMNANTLQFLQEFKRYQELIRRPSIQRELVAERENLLGKLSEYIGREKKSFRDVGPSRSVPGVPKTVNNVYFVRQLEAKVKDIIKTGGVVPFNLISRTRWMKMLFCCRRHAARGPEFVAEGEGGGGGDGRRDERVPA